ncbi:MAG: hypothetical protein IJ595_11015 [Oscillospiraceae bacterium]|nr:hypothetical protein [Oscillospiraceae bacterium]
MKAAKQALALMLAAACLLAAGCSDAPDTAANENAGEHADENAGGIAETVSFDAETADAEPVKAGASYTFKDFPIDGYVTECESCNKAFEYLSAKIKAIHHIEERKDTDNLYVRAYKGVEERIYPLMKHECTLPVIYVENIAYSFYRNNGYYTGYWQGAGPCGEGTFVGFDRMGSYDSYYEYQGDWKYGLPNGTGFFIGSSEFDNSECYYRGGFQDGYRSGTGTICVVLDDKYRVVRDAQWSDDHVVGEVEVVDYNLDDGSIYGWGTGVGVGNGLELQDYMTMQGVKDRAAVAATIAGFIAFNKLVDEIFPPTEMHLSTSQEMAEMVKKYEAEKADQAAKSEEAYKHDTKAYADSMVKKYDQMGDMTSGGSRYWRSTQEDLSDY